MGSVEQDLFERAPAAFVLFDAEGTILAYNPMLAEWARAPKDLPPDALIGQNLLDWLLPEDRKIYRTRLLPELRREGKVREAVVQAVDFEGTAHPIILNADIVVEEDGSERIYTVLMDAALRIAFEREIVEAKRRADEAHARLSLLQRATSRLAVTTGIDELGAVLAEATIETTQAGWALVQLSEPGGEQEAPAYWGDAPLPLAAIGELELPLTPVVCRTPEDIEASFPGIAAPLLEQGVHAMMIVPITRTDAAGTRAIGAIHCWCSRNRDLEQETLESLTALTAQADQMIEHLRLQEEVRHRATHDALTGLPNMRLVEERLSQLPAAALRSGHPCAVLFLDLDGFKAINDQRGHATGDEALRTVAARLRGACRANEMVGRIGGDEFVVVVEYIDEAGLAGLASRILRVVSEPLGLDGEASPLSTSVGAIIWRPAPDDEPPTAAQLLEAADEAMYEAKRGGKGAFVLREWKGR